MLESSIGGMRANQRLRLMVLACGAGLLLGVASLLATPFLTLGALIVAGLAVAALRKPELAIVGILAATSSIVFENKLPTVPVGVGRLHIPDILLLSLLGLILVRWLVEPEYRIRRTPLDLPLMLFYGFGLLSTVFAIFGTSLPVEEARRAVRVFSYYLVFFAVTNLAREEHQHRFLVNSLAILATIVAAFMAVQFAIGDANPLLPGKLDVLTTQGAEFGGVTRIRPPGQSIILVAFVSMSVAYAAGNAKTFLPIRFSQWGLLALALILTFNRSYWVAAFLALGLIFTSTRGKDRVRFIKVCMIALIVLTLFTFAAYFSPGTRAERLVRGAFVRVATLTNVSTIQESSLQWRYVENRYALNSIASRPLLGAGLGAQYRPLDSRIDFPGRQWDARGYIHNGHFWILVKTGLLGYFSLIWLSALFLRRSLCQWRLLPTRFMRGTVLSNALTYLGVLAIAVTSPVLMEWSWTPILGLVMGINEAILALPRDTGESRHELSNREIA